MSLPIYRATAPRIPSVVVGALLGPAFSVSTITIKAGGADQDLEIGAVLGCRLFGVPVAAAVAGNTGNGAAGAVALGPLVKVGVYRLRCTTAAANAGTFAVFAPDGARMADLTVGQAYDNGHFSVTIADGTTDFVVGDGFTISVPLGDERYSPLDFAATDGTALAAAVLIENIVIPAGADQQAAAVTCFAKLKEPGLIWPAGATDTQKAAALRCLSDRSIIIAQEV